jgi:hypothetical protein
VDNFPIDSRAFPAYEAPMHDADARAHQIRILSGVAGHLCSALEALARSDCDWYTTDLLEMLSAIDGQIAALKELDARPV